MANTIFVSGATPATNTTRCTGFPPWDKKGNLEQIRAANALKAADGIGTGNEGGKAVAKKVPAQIIQNGLLASLAFAIESVEKKEKDISRVTEYGWYESKGEKCGYANTFLSIMKHLKSVSKDLGVCEGDLKDFLDGLCAKSAEQLRMVTDEALCYLNYLRRFAKPGKDEQSAESEG